MTGKRLGNRCARLANPVHGSWYFAVQVTDMAGRRQRLRRGGFPTADAARQAACDLAVSLEAAPVTECCTVAQWLHYWLSVVEQRIRPTTYKAYRDHIRLFLIPHLGPIPLRRLSRRHVVKMFTTVASRRTRYGKPISAATLERIRATLRAALNEAVREDLIRDDPARGLRLPSSRHVHPVVWTPRRAAAWRRTGHRPAVAVWTVEQLTEFLAFVRDDRLFALWWLIALCGLRRAEVAGLRWIDLDTDQRELTISCQLVHTDHGLLPCPPKSASSQRGIALDLDTLRLLHRHERAQRDEMSTAWSPSTPMFTRENGEAIDPDYLSYRLHKLVLASGLPPVRLHDLRHGAATLALAAGAGPARGARTTRTCQHRAHRRHVHVGAAAAVSRERPGHRPAGSQSRSQDRTQGQQRPPWYVTHMCPTVTHDQTTRLQNLGEPQVRVVGRPGSNPEPTD
ncbi:site-specific integrase [Nonomuraea gerenzanensis]|uniref:site-specific integrase n=1 Tax=Nonomuraea gerenzanensis TaxID=93944 RepID=UPI001CDA008F|nr:tyrosine-type recombinase/integrase [Nonomuraea gerenzanensis]UBU12969.1 site-specific integrase [Nonomuraea gerenzanensis]